MASSSIASRYLAAIETSQQQQQNPVVGSSGGGGGGGNHSRTSTPVPPISRHQGPNPSLSTSFPTKTKTPSPPPSFIMRDSGSSASPRQKWKLMHSTTATMTSTTSSSLGSTKTPSPSKRFSTTGTVSTMASSTCMASPQVRNVHNSPSSSKQSRTSSVPQREGIESAVTRSRASPVVMPSGTHTSSSRIRGAPSPAPLVRLRPTGFFQSHNAVTSKEREEETDESSLTSREATKAPEEEEEERRVMTFYTATSYEDDADETSSIDSEPDPPPRRSQTPTSSRMMMMRTSPPTGVSQTASGTRGTGNSARNSGVGKNGRATTPTGSAVTPTRPASGASWRKKLEGTSQGMRLSPRRVNAGVGVGDNSWIKAQHNTSWANKEDIPTSSPSRKGRLPSHLLNPTEGRSKSPHPLTAQLLKDRVNDPAAAPTEVMMNLSSRRPPPATIRLNAPGDDSPTEIMTNTTANVFETRLRSSLPQSKSTSTGGLNQNPLHRRAPSPRTPFSNSQFVSKGRSSPHHKVVNNSENDVESRPIPALLDKYSRPRSTTPTTATTASTSIVQRIRQHEERSDENNTTTLYVSRPKGPAAPVAKESLPQSRAASHRQSPQVQPQPPPAPSSGAKATRRWPPVQTNYGSGRASPPTTMARPAPQRHSPRNGLHRPKGDIPSLLSVDSSTEDNDQEMEAIIDSVLEQHQRHIEHERNVSSAPPKITGGVGKAKDQRITPSPAGKLGRHVQQRSATELEVALRNAAARSCGLHVPVTQHVHDDGKMQHHTHPHHGDEGSFQGKSISSIGVETGIGESKPMRLQKMFLQSSALPSPGEKQPSMGENQMSSDKNMYGCTPRSVTPVSRPSASTHFPHQAAYMQQKQSQPKPKPNKNFGNREEQSTPGTPELLSEADGPSVNSSGPPTSLDYRPEDTTKTTAQQQPNYEKDPAARSKPLPLMPKFPPTKTKTASTVTGSSGGNNPFHVQYSKQSQDEKRVVAPQPQHHHPSNKQAAPESPTSSGWTPVPFSDDEDSFPKHPQQQSPSQKLGDQPIFSSDRLDMTQSPFRRWQTGTTFPGATNSLSTNEDSTSFPPALKPPWSNKQKQENRAVSESNRRGPTEDIIKRSAGIFEGNVTGRMSPMSVKHRAALVSPEQPEAFEKEAPAAVDEKDGQKTGRGTPTPHTKLTGVMAHTRARKLLQRRRDERRGGQGTPICSGVIGRTKRVWPPPKHVEEEDEGKGEIDPVSNPSDMELSRPGVGERSSSVRDRIKALSEARNVTSPDSLEVRSPQEDGDELAGIMSPSDPRSPEDPSRVASPPVAMSRYLDSVRNASDWRPHKSPAREKPRYKVSRAENREHAIRDTSPFRGEKSPQNLMLMGALLAMRAEENRDDDSLDVQSLRSMFEGNSIQSPTDDGSIGTVESLDVKSIRSVFEEEEKKEQEKGSTVTKAKAMFESGPTDRAKTKSFAGNNVVKDAFAKFEAKKTPTTKRSWQSKQAIETKRGSPLSGTGRKSPWGGGVLSPRSSRKQQELGPITEDDLDDAVQLEGDHETNEPRVSVSERIRELKRRSPVTVGGPNNNTKGNSFPVLEPPRGSKKNSPSSCKKDGAVLPVVDPPPPPPGFPKRSPPRKGRNGMVTVPRNPVAPKFVEQKSKSVEGVTKSVEGVTKSAERKSNSEKISVRDRIRALSAAKANAREDLQGDGTENPVQSKDNPAFADAGTGEEAHLRTEYPSHRKENPARASPTASDSAIMNTGRGSPSNYYLSREKVSVSKKPLKSEDVRSPRIEYSESRTESEGYDDGVTLDLSIADVSALTNPTCLRSKDGESLAPSSPQTQTQPEVEVEVEGRGPSEASSSQTSEAAAPLIQLTMKMKYASSDDYTNEKWEPTTPSVDEKVKATWDEEGKRWMALDVEDEDGPSVDQDDGAWDLRNVTKSFPAASSDFADPFSTPDDDRQSPVANAAAAWSPFPNSVPRTETVTPPRRRNLGLEPPAASASTSPATPRTQNMSARRLGALRIASSTSRKKQPNDIPMLLQPRPSLQTSPTNTPPKHTSPLSLDAGREVAANKEGSRSPGRGAFGRTSPARPGGPNGGRSSPVSTQSVPVAGSTPSYAGYSKSALLKHYERVKESGNEEKSEEVGRSPPGRTPPPQVSTTRFSPPGRTAGSSPVEEETTANPIPGPPSISKHSALMMRLNSLKQARLRRNHTMNRQYYEQRRKMPPTPPAPKTKSPSRSLESKQQQQQQPPPESAPSPYRSKHQQQQHHYQNEPEGSYNSRQYFMKDAPSEQAPSPSRRLGEEEYSSSTSRSSTKFGGQAFEGNLALD